MKGRCTTAIRLSAGAVLGVLAVLAATNQETTFIGARAKYWAFQTVKRPAPPALSDAWVRTPIDAFILQALREKQLTPSTALDRAQLIRRVTYDLIGLPPTPEEVASFLRDKS